MSHHIQAWNQKLKDFRQKLKKFNKETHLSTKEALILTHKLDELNRVRYQTFVYYFAGNEEYQQFINEMTTIIDNIEHDYLPE